MVSITASATRHGGQDPQTTRASLGEGLLPGTLSAGVADAMITAKSTALKHLLASQHWLISGTY